MFLRRRFPFLKKTLDYFLSRLEIIVLTGCIGIGIGVAQSCNSSRHNALQNEVKKLEVVSIGTTNVDNEYTNTMEGNR